MKRYIETQAQSAELLRMVLSRLPQHDAPFHPISFAVWYEHLSGVNPRLSQALEQALKREPRLTDDSLRRLYQDHVAEVDSATAERVSGGFQRVMQSMTEAAARTNASAGEFGHQLGGLSTALGQAETGGSQDLVARMSDALAGTARMQAAVDALQQQVASSRGEIEQLRSDLERTREEALLCPLSKLLNRKGFDHRLHSLLYPAQPEQAEPAPGACLVMIDIDHFKKINDTHGHLIGDRVLEAMGEVLRATVKDPGAATARFGGEEFAILLPGPLVGKGVELAEAVREGVKRIRVRQRSTDKLVLSVTVSAGVATSRLGDDASALIARADAALYRSKNTGRDRVVVG